MVLSRACSIVVTMATPLAQDQGPQDPPVRAALNLEEVEAAEREEEREQLVVGGCTDLSTLSPEPTEIHAASTLSPYS